MKHAMLLVVALAAFGCKKDKAEDKKGTGSGTATGTGTASASGSGTASASGSGSGTASASGSGTASASGSGEASGTGTASGTGAAGETFELGNVMPDQWFAKGGGCSKVVKRIAGCAKDKKFLDALTADNEPEDVKAQNERAGAFAKFGDDPDGYCEQLVSVTYEDEGFLMTRWDDLGEDELADCAKLGESINEALGLPGGSVDE